MTPYKPCIDDFRELLRNQGFVVDGMFSEMWKLNNTSVWINDNEIKVIDAFSNYHRTFHRACGGLVLAMEEFA